MAITLLGGVTVDDHVVRLNPRDRAVLATLALRNGETVRAEQLADALWGDAPPSSWSKNLQGCISRLRKALGPDAIQTVGSGYRLVVADEDVDILKFEQLTRRGRELLEVGHADRATYMFGEALELWRGEPLVELEGWEPGRVEAARLEELKLETEELAVEAALRSGQHLAVLAEARSLAEAAPLRERRWELLARAQYQAGQQTEALRTIRRVRTVLARELGLDPGPGLTSLEEAILRQDPTLEIDEAPGQASNLCPYQGLKPYDVEDAEGFFGRDELIDACLQRLGDRGFLAVVGPSGSGKSSLVRAGVAARLRRQGSRVIVMTPGPDPYDAFTRGRIPSSRTTIVVDQFEEVFSLCNDAEQRERFVAALVEHAGRGAVVMAMRADHIGDLAAHPRLVELVEPGLHLLSPMDEEQLRAAVEGPARQAGLVVEPGLVDLLIREVRGEPGALPLLSHVLRETWLRREGRTLTVEGYRASGGIREAVAQSAESVFNAVDPANQRVLRDLLLRLVTPGPEGAPIRTRMPRRLVVSDPSNDALVDLLIASRLVISDDGVVELAHEALADAWPRLREWLDDDVEGQRLLHHLTQAADAWDSLGRPDSELYRGTRLSRALEWQAATSSELTSTELAFLDAGRRQAEREEQSAAKQARVQGRMIRRLRIVLVGATALLIVAMVSGGLAVHQKRVADDNAAAALAAESSSDARRVGARAQLSDDISLSLLQAASAVRLSDEPETWTNLMAAVDKWPQLVRSAPAGGGYIDIMDVSPDGNWVAASDDQNVMHLYDAATDQLVGSYAVGPTPEGQSGSIPRFSPDNHYLAIGRYTPAHRPLRLLDPRTMREAPISRELSEGTRSAIADLGFSDDGRFLAATMNVPARGRPAIETPGYALVWDLRSPSNPPQRVPTGKGVQGMALSPDGRTLYTAVPATAYDVASGKVIWRRDDVNTWVAFEANPQGTRLALELYDNRKNNKILVLDANNGRTIKVLRGHHDQVRDLRFSSDGRLVASASSDGQVIVWDVASGTRLEQLETLEQTWSVDFSPADDLIYTGGDDGMLRTWAVADTQTYVPQQAEVRDAKVYSHADLSPDGSKVAYRWLQAGKGRIAFVNTRTGSATRPVSVPDDYSPWSPGIWSEDSSRYAAYWKGRVWLLDPTTGHILLDRNVLDNDIYGDTYLADDQSLLVGGAGGTVLLDADTLDAKGLATDVPSDCCPAVSPDGKTVVVFEDTSDGAGERWRLLDLATGKVLREGDLAVRVYSAVVSPDGREVAVTGQTGEVVTIDLSDGELKQGSTALGTEVLWLRYSDDGSRLVSSAADGAVSLWEASSLQLLGSIHPAHRGDPVAASADFVGGLDAVTIASFDGGIFRWNTGVEHTLEYACQMAGRNLSQDEWRNNYGDRPYQQTCPSH